jgi:hypothetical protein
VNSRKLYGSSDVDGALLNGIRPLCIPTPRRTAEPCSTFGQYAAWKCAGAP